MLRSPHLSHRAGLRLLAVMALFALLASACSNDSLRLPEDSSAAAVPAEPADDAADSGGDGGAEEADDATSALEVEPEPTPTPTPTPFGEDDDPLTLFVDPVGGAEDADGQRPSTAFLRIDQAVSIVEPGSTVYLMDGTHTGPPGQGPNGSAVFPIERSGTPEAYVHITAFPEHSPRIEGTLRNNAFEIHADYVQISGLTIIAAGELDGPGYGSGIIAYDSHHLNYYDNTISGFSSTGIGSTRSAHHRIVGNTIFENAFFGPEQGSGISLHQPANIGGEPDANGYSNVVSDNVVHSNANLTPADQNLYPFVPDGEVTDGNGIIVDESNVSGFEGRTLIANNLFYGNGGRAVTIFRSSYIDVIHNTTYQNAMSDNLFGTAGEITVTESQDVRVLNNISWARDGLPGLIQRASDGLISEGNVFTTTDPGSASESDQVLEGDPGFTTAGADFRLTDSSPAIDAGVTTPLELPFDIDGDPRGAGNPPDAGAYEFQP